ncbi:sperm-associated antigen 16 protein-like [Octopus sinensis]|uniref:Sperm-associated antigen 16 protein-like n=1 Tax=Octopus sinensis TaxID=2607531 RepID=A0A6P7U6E6_9MOLL|nr:sperm-associated antigen 16 protein-like [Octopus sinensis]
MEKYIKVQKERNFHSLKHRRLEQEKQTLIKNLKIVTFGHSREIILAGCEDGNLKLFSSCNFSFESCIPAHSTWISSCRFNPQQTHILSSAADGLVKLWNLFDVDLAECLTTIEEHRSVVWDCAWHSGGDFIATASFDGTSKVIDLNTQRCRSILRYHKNSINSVEFLPFSCTILTASADKTMVIWDGRTVFFNGHTLSPLGKKYSSRDISLLSMLRHSVLKLKFFFVC